ncbi:hypothetical protein HOE07_00840 [archaeon]|nr:hypothetical protein [archaeon]
MTLELKKINVENYAQEKDRMYALAERIWPNPSSLENIKHSLDRWGNSGTESGTYFYITQEEQDIGITGYYIPNLETGDFGLRHHGITVSGTGRIALDALVSHLREEYGSNFKRMIELIPKGREELIDVFRKWGFVLSTDGVPNWEPKKDYYEYVMVKEVGKR